VLNPGLNRRERNKGIEGVSDEREDSPAIEEWDEENVRETGAKMGENPHSEPGSLSPPPPLPLLHTHTHIHILSLAGVQLVDLTNSPIDLCLPRLHPRLSRRKEGVRLLRKWMHFTPQG